MDNESKPCLRIEQYLQQWVSLTPDAEAIVDSYRRMTYIQLNSAVLKAASLLTAHEVVDGSCIAVLAPPSINTFVSFLAANLLGATWLGLNPKYSRTELDHVIRDAKPLLILAYSQIGDRSYKQDLQAICADVDGTKRVPVLYFEEDRLPGVDESGFHEDLFSKGQEPKNAIALFVYTSGTTGKPKAARISHKALIHAASVRVKSWNVAPFRSINNLPINHIGSIGDIACTTLLAGGTQVCLERFSPVATLDCIQRERVSYWYQVPTMFQLCLDAAETIAMDWSSLRAAIWSGGRASHVLINRLASVAKFVAVDYSMTESVGAITLAPLTSDTSTLDDCIGWPVAERGIRLVDPETLLPVVVGEAGEVQLFDQWMFDGYRDGVRSSDGFTLDGWFRTGDLAVQLENGSWRIVGRSKEMFKSGGYNVYPREVEMVIELHPDVSAVAVVETSDPLYGEVGVAFVVLEDNCSDASALDAHCRKHLANYKIPKHFVEVNQLPMLPIGKVDKVALRGRAAIRD
jgi:acyl-CoA synthetase (AMP-forming)/AMP-acid ligase II